MYGASTGQRRGVNADVAKDKKVHVLAKLFGGQGTINVPSWSPNSQRLAFVSYEYLPQEDRPTLTRP